MEKEFALYAALTPSELGYCTELYPSDPMLFMHFIQYIKSRLYESNSYSRQQALQEKTTIIPEHCVKSCITYVSELKPMCPECSALN